MTRLAGQLVLKLSGFLFFLAFHNKVMAVSNADYGEFRRFVLPGFSLAFTILIEYG